MHQNHRHNQCIKNALKRAQTLSARRGVRLTPIRRKVLELIWQSHKPAKAYDLLAQLSTDGHLEKPPTVYRALQFLIDNHLVHRIESCNGYVGCAVDHEQTDSQFFVCDECHEVAELCEPRLNRVLIDSSRKLGFTPNQVTVEIHGTCSNCVN